MSRASWLGAVLLAVVSTGCFRMTIVNGRPPAEGPGAMEEKWRSATILDVVDIDGPASLDGLCKETGWAKIRQVHTPVNWLVDVFLAGGIVYESTEVTIHCAKRAAPPAAPPPTVTPTPSQPPPTPTQPPSTPAVPPPTQL